MCGIYREALHVDHITPRAMGGGDEPENLQLLCPNCHQDKTKDDFVKMDHGKRCREGRKKALEKLTPEQKEKRREERSKIGKKSAKYMQNMTAEERKAHGDKIRAAQAKMSPEQKQAMKKHLDSVRHKAVQGRLRTLRNMTEEQRKKSYGTASKRWHDSLSPEEKEIWKGKISEGAQNESAESRAARIKGSKKAASRFKRMSDAQLKEWGALCLAGRQCAN